ncbi:hypothetical protein MKZ38_001110 [Zalerion maritima]|uniref:Uncharacterized protein n=1 Tax=Zalerion maritima TaxID=339359 RepID=A0AAD5RQL8_9PEZI|nr:hypothetical protein MKZ38_001110 [Zalerion maritima]
MSILCCCFRPRSPKTPATSKPVTIVRKPAQKVTVPPTPGADHTPNKPPEKKIVASERLPSLQLDLSVVSSMSIDPTSVMTAHDDDDEDSNDKNDQGGGVGARNPNNRSPVSQTSQPAQPTSTRSSLIRHLSLDSLSKKRHSRLEVGRSDDEVARRGELRRIRRQRIQDELSSEAAMENNQASSVYSRSSADKPLLVLRGCPRDTLEFAIATHPEGQNHVDTGSPPKPHLPPVMGICPDTMYTDNEIHTSEARRNSCPDRFQATHDILPRKNSQISVKPRHSAATCCYPRPRILGRSRTSEMASMVSWRMSHSKRMGKAIEEDMMLGTQTPSVRSLISRSDLDASIPEKDLETEALEPLVESRETNVKSMKISSAEMVRRSKSSSSYLKGQSAIGRNELSKSRNSDPDNHLPPNDASSSVYSVSSHGSPSTHTASRLDVRGLKVSRSSIVRLALPTWSGSFMTRSKSSDHSHQSNVAASPSTQLRLTTTSLATCRPRAIRSCSDCGPRTLERSSQSIFERTSKRWVTITGTDGEELGLPRMNQQGKASQLGFVKKKSPLILSRPNFTPQHPPKASPSVIQDLGLRPQNMTLTPMARHSSRSTEKLRPGPSGHLREGRSEMEDFIARTDTMSEKGANVSPENCTTSPAETRTEWRRALMLDGVGEDDTPNHTRVLRRSPKVHIERQVNDQKGRGITERESYPQPFLHGTYTWGMSSSPQRRDFALPRMETGFSRSDPIIPRTRIPVRSSSESFLNPTQKHIEKGREQHHARTLRPRVSDLPPMTEDKIVTDWTERNHERVPRASPRDHIVQGKESTTTLQFATPKSHMSTTDDETTSSWGYEDAQSTQSMQLGRNEDTVVKRSSSVMDERDRSEKYWSVRSKSYQSIFVKDTKFESELYGILRNEKEAWGPEGVDVEAALQVRGPGFHGAVASMA